MKTYRLYTLTDKGKVAVLWYRLNKLVSEKIAHLFKSIGSEAEALLWDERLTQIERGITEIENDLAGYPPELKSQVY